MLVDLDLRDIDDLDALTRMLKLTYSYEDWRPMIAIANKLYDEAYRLYSIQLKDYSDTGSHTYNRPLSYYLGFSQLAKGISLQKQGFYKESRKCIEKYKDLSWIICSNERDIDIISNFKSFAEGNEFTLDLLEGKEEVLPVYVKHIRKRKEDVLEVLAGIITLFEAALKNNFDIDWIINEFNSSLEEVKVHCHDNIVNIRYFTEYLYLSSLYKFRKKNFSDALKSTLEGLEYSVKLKDNTAFKKNVALYEAFREYARVDQEENYRMQLLTILEGVLEDEKNISFNDLCSDSYH
ncbi:hypothetical protein F4V43_12420 [Paenibacillus spiritus]|uniref:DNA-binding protein n=1 Tax=Paenibacillus spiritus TaxID=2496557 RepID=A0A5J5G9R6_9BACL|nr:hypothetical protein [Paenibacillus spiritus]KAA9004193.1 hypothetical protein F4V43_12420 [Paenibacillus spiritus]